MNLTGNEISTKKKHKETKKYAGAAKCLGRHEGCAENYGRRGVPLSAARRYECWKASLVNRQKCWMTARDRQSKRDLWEPRKPWKPPKPETHHETLWKLSATKISIRDDARGARIATVSPEEGRPRLRITMSRPKATTTHGDPQDSWELPWVVAKAGQRLGEEFWGVEVSRSWAVPSEVSCQNFKIHFPAAGREVWILEPWIPNLGRPEYAITEHFLTITHTHGAFWMQTRGGSFNFEILNSAFWKALGLPCYLSNFEF